MDLTDGGDGREGCPHTEEERAKISASNKGQVPWIKGKHHKEETKVKIAASLMGHEVPQSVRDKISVPLKRMRSTNAPVISAGVNAANMHWKATNANSGISWSKHFWSAPCLRRTMPTPASL